MSGMKFFSKNEVVGVSVILSIIVVASLYNFRLALRRARDAERRSDLGSISNALSRYNDDFGFFPPGSPDGKIKACKGETFEEKIREISRKDPFYMNKFFEALEPCRWGIDGLRDLSDESYPPYLKVIPGDPKANEGIVYSYLSNTKRFQIFAYLEGEEKEEGYSRAIVERQILCGVKICNFGKVYGETPLDKSLEEYENELMEK